MTSSKSAASTTKCPPITSARLTTISTSSSLPSVMPSLVDTTLHALNFVVKREDVWKNVKDGFLDALGIGPDKKERSKCHKRQQGHDSLQKRCGGHGGADGHGGTSAGNGGGGGEDSGTGTGGGNQPPNPGVAAATSGATRTTSFPGLWISLFLVLVVGFLSMGTAASTTVLPDDVSSTSPLSAVPEASELPENPLPFDLSSVIIDGSSTAPQASTPKGLEKRKSGGKGGGSGGSTLVLASRANPRPDSFLKRKVLIIVLFIGLMIAGATAGPTNNATNIAVSIPTADGASSSNVIGANTTLPQPTPGSVGFFGPRFRFDVATRERTANGNYNDLEPEPTSVQVESLSPLHDLAISDRERDTNAKSTHVRHHHHHYVSCNRTLANPNMPCSAAPKRLSISQTYILLAVAVVVSCFISTSLAATNTTALEAVPAITRPSTLSAPPNEHSREAPGKHSRDELAPPFIEERVEVSGGGYDITPDSVDGPGYHVALNQYYGDEYKVNHGPTSSGFRKSPMPSVKLAFLAVAVLVGFFVPGAAGTAIITRSSTKSFDLVDINSRYSTLPDCTISVPSTYTCSSSNPAIFKEHSTSKELFKMRFEDLKWSRTTFCGWPQKCSAATTSSQGRFRWTILSLSFLLFFITGATASTVPVLSIAPSTSLQPTYHPTSTVKTTLEPSAISIPDNEQVKTVENGEPEKYGTCQECHRSAAPKAHPVSTFRSLLPLGLFLLYYIPGTIVSKIACALRTSSSNDSQPCTDKPVLGSSQAPRQGNESDPEILQVAEAGQGVPINLDSTNATKVRSIQAAQAAEGFPLISKILYTATGLTVLGLLAGAAAHPFFTDLAGLYLGRDFTSEASVAVCLRCLPTFSLSKQWLSIKMAFILWFSSLSLYKSLNATKDKTLLSGRASRRRTAPSASPSRPRWTRSLRLPSVLVLCLTTQTSALVLGTPSAAYPSAPSLQVGAAHGHFHARGYSPLRHAVGYHAAVSHEDSLPTASTESVRLLARE